MKLIVSEFFDLSKTLARELLEEVLYPWEAIGRISDTIIRIGQGLPEDRYIDMGKDIWCAKTAVIAPTAYIEGPAIIGENTNIRHCAYIRGSVIIGNNAVVGNSSEIKNSILFDEVQVPHFNYVGDSILGYRAHLGAGVVISNLKSDKSMIIIQESQYEYKTNQKKLGAIIGDYVEVGCNSVLNPGTMIGKNTNIYPLSMVRGVIESGVIYKNKNEICIKE